MREVELKVTFLRCNRVMDYCCVIEKSGRRVKIKGKNIGLLGKM